MANITNPKEEKIEMEKIYPNLHLEKLLPIRDFYERKTLSKKHKNYLECGYAGGW